MGLVIRLREAISAGDRRVLRGPAPARPPGQAVTTARRSPRRSPPAKAELRMLGAARSRRWRATGFACPADARPEPFHGRQRSARRRSDAGRRREGWGAGSSQRPPQARRSAARSAVKALVGAAVVAVVVAGCLDCRPAARTPRPGSHTGTTTHGPPPSARRVPVMRVRTERTRGRRWAKQRASARWCERPAVGPAARDRPPLRCRSVWQEPPWSAQRTRQRPAARAHAKNRHVGRRARPPGLRERANPRLAAASRRHSLRTPTPIPARARPALASQGSPRRWPRRRLAPSATPTTPAPHTPKFQRARRKLTPARRHRDSA